MCMGGKSADAYYEEKKVDYGPLPSLTMSKVERKKQKLTDTRVGAPRRSLLNPIGDTNA
jgi:hypothetical protein